MPERARGATVAGEIAGGSRALAAAGLADAGRVATGIWAALVGSSPGKVWFRRGQRAAPSVARRFREAVDRHARGEPLAYAVGTAAFRTLVLEVDRRVLIPRPETEGLVDQVLAWGAGRREPWGLAVDVGTGSGALALSLAVEGRFARVIATDVSAEALALAERNRALVSPPAPVELRLGPWLEPVEGEVEVIVTNPPYVTRAEYEMLEPSVRAFEPAVALLAGADGLDPTRRILEQARARLAPGGLLAVEVDSRRATAALALARAAGWADARLAADLFGRDRYLLATGARG